MPGERGNRDVTRDRLWSTDGTSQQQQRAGAAAEAAAVAAATGQCAIGRRCALHTPAHIRAGRRASCLHTAQTTQSMRPDRAQLWPHVLGHVWVGHDDKLLGAKGQLEDLAVNAVQLEQRHKHGLRQGEGGRVRVTWMPRAGSRRAAAGAWELGRQRTRGIRRQQKAEAVHVRANTAAVVPAEQAVKQHSNQQASQQASAAAAPVAAAAAEWTAASAQQQPTGACNSNSRQASPAAASSSSEHQQASTHLAHNLSDVPRGCGHALCCAPLPLLPNLGKLHRQRTACGAQEIGHAQEMGSWVPASGATRNMGS